MKKLVTLLSIGLLLGACSSSNGKAEETSDSQERAKTGQNKVEQLREKKRKEREEKEKEKEDEEDDEEEED